MNSRAYIGFSWRRDFIPNELWRNPSRAAEILRRIQWIGRMNFRTGITAIGDAAGIPERPSRCWCCPWYASRRCLEEVELVGRVFVHGATDEDEEGEKKGACDEDERHEAENWSCRQDMG